MQSKTECWACKNDIIKGAKFCEHCKKWQNWRQWIDVSSRNIALALAIFSLSGVLIATYQTNFVAKKSYVKSFLHRIDESGIKVVVYNTSDFDYLIGSKMACIFGDVSENPVVEIISGVHFDRVSEKCENTGGVFPIVKPGGSCGIYFKPILIDNYSRAAAVDEKLKINSCNLIDPNNQAAGTLQPEPMDDLGVAIQNLEKHFTNIPFGDFYD